MNNVTHAHVLCLTSKIKKGKRLDMRYFAHISFHSKSVATKEKKSATKEVIRGDWIHQNYHNHMKTSIFQKISKYGAFGWLSFSLNDDMYDLFLRDFIILDLSWCLDYYVCVIMPKDLLNYVFIWLNMSTCEEIMKL